MQRGPDDPEVLQGVGGGASGRRGLGSPPASLVPPAMPCGGTWALHKVRTPAGPAGRSRAACLRRLAGVLDQQFRVFPHHAMRSYRPVWDFLERGLQAAGAARLHGRYGQVCSRPGGLDSVWFGVQLLNSIFRGGSHAGHGPGGHGIEIWCIPRPAMADLIPRAGSCVCAASDRTFTLLNDDLQGRNYDAGSMACINQLACFGGARLGSPPSRSVRGTAMPMLARPMSLGQCGTPQHPRQGRVRNHYAPETPQCRYVHEYRGMARAGQVRVADGNGNTIAGSRGNELAPMLFPPPARAYGTCAHVMRDEDRSPGRLPMRACMQLHSDGV